MGLPEVNRARIEKLNKMMVELYGEVEKIDPIVTDDSFPDIDPPVPQRVTATPLFRSIQVTWDFKGDSYISHYEVFASKERNFTPRDEHLIWAGLSGGFQHRASTGETWYFRVRSVNRHGRASALSHQVEATTVSIDGFEIDEQYKIDTLQEANQYTEERKNEIMLELANKVDADYLYDNLILKADIDYVDSEFTRVNTAITQLEGEIDLRVTEEKYQRQIEGENGLISRMNNAESSINVLTNEINLRVTEEELDIRMGDVVHRLDLAESQIAINTEAIESKVERTTYEALEQRVEVAETAITQKADSIVIDAIQQDLDAKAQELSEIQSTLTIQAGQIEQRVEKNGIISSINQTAEEIKISASRVAIDGDLVVTDGLVRLKDAIIDKTHIKQGLIEELLTANLIAEKINAGTALIDFAKIGNVEITDAMIAELDGQKIKANSITTEQLNIITRDLINNPTRSGNLDGWIVWHDSVGDSVLDLTERTYREVPGLTCARLTSSGDLHVHSNLIEIDPSKTYKLSASMWSPSSVNRINFGVYVYDKNMNRIAVNRFRFEHVNDWVADTDDPYFWQGHQAGWVDMEGYLLGASVEENAIPAGKNIQSAYRFPPNAKYIRVRFLNWFNDGTRRSVYVYSPTVTEVDSGTIRAENIIGGTIEGVTIKGTGNTRVEMHESFVDFYYQGTRVGRIFGDDSMMGSAMSIHAPGVVEMRSGAYSADWSNIDANISIVGAYANGDVSLVSRYGTRERQATIALSGLLREVFIGSPNVLWIEAPGGIVAENSNLISRLTHSGGYFHIHPYNSDYDDGTFVRGFYSGFSRGTYNTRTLNLRYAGFSSGWVKVDAGDFSTRSTEDLKENIVEWEDSVLEYYRDRKKFQLYEYDMKNSPPGSKRKHGIVIKKGQRDYPEWLTDENENSVSMYEFNAMNARALQETVERDDRQDERLSKLEERLALLEQQMVEYYKGGDNDESN